MSHIPESEFGDEYQDWLDGGPVRLRAGWLDVSVDQLEKHRLLSVAPASPLGDAVALMNAHERGAVLVVEGERLVGIFTERDVLRRVLPLGLDLQTTPVHQVMTADPDTLDRDATLGQALRTMARARYRHLPVIDEAGRPIGVVSMRRIIQFVCEAFPQEILNAPPERHSVTVELEGA